MKNLESHITRLINIDLKQDKLNGPKDYFSWGRDSRHIVDNTERLPSRVSAKKSLRRIARESYYFVLKLIGANEKVLLSRFNRHYSTFDQSYQLMSDQYSKNLFAELILMKLVSEKNMGLSSFQQDFIDAYERASDKILSSSETLPVYKWILREVKLDDPPISFFTVPTILNLHYTGRLYRYHQEDVTIEVEGGDTVIDAGVGWGDTTIYLAALANKNPGGHSYAFDILEEGMAALSEQCKLNPHTTNITPILKALSDKDGEQVNISLPGPGAKVVNQATERSVETTTIDTYVENNSLNQVNFIKMDIEGAEVPALVGATNTIKKFKPKLAISVYHKWDDLLVIPQLINNIRSDYRYYLDCTTGFGGETVLYCQ